MENTSQNGFDFRTSNKHEVISHLKNGGELSQFTFQRFRDDKDVFIEAIKHYEHATMFASETLRADKSLMMESVKSNGITLKHASKQLRADKEVVLEAVKQDGNAVKYASQELKADKEVVLQAVKEIRSKNIGDYVMNIVLQRASTDIQELCKGKDPVQALEVAIRMEKMQSELKPKPPSQKLGLKI